MRGLLAVIAAVVCVSTVAAQQAPAPPTPAKIADIAGKWTATLELEIGTSTPALEFKQDAGKITGTYTSQRYGAAPLTGTIGADRKLTFTVKLEAEGQQVSMVFSGIVSTDGSMLGGKVEIEGMGEGTWTAKRPS
jgi:hypothetical protein